MHGHCGRRGVAPQLILGLGAMALGMVLVLENFGVVEARRMVRFWPLLLVGIGAYRLYDSVSRGMRPAGHVLVLVGAGLLLLNLGLIRAWQGVAAFLLVAGAVMTLRALRRGPESAEGEALAADPDLDLFAFMAHITRTVGDRFRGGQVSALMGACEIDLRGARVDGEAVINVFAFWGGVEIRVPSDWVVEGRGMAVLGGFEDNSRRPDDARQKLIITGIVIMGGLEVKN